MPPLLLYGQIAMFPDVNKTHNIQNAVKRMLKIKVSDWAKLGKEVKKHFQKRIRSGTVEPKLSETTKTRKRAIGAKYPSKTLYEFGGLARQVVNKQVSNSTFVGYNERENHKTKRKSNPMSVAKLAGILQFGTPKIPARPFIFIEIEERKMANRWLRIVMAQNTIKK